jgi:O-antigen biosynthesis protein
LVGGKQVKTSIIIATYNKFDFTQKCIDSIRQYTTKEDYEIIVVDNDSKDETRNWLKKQKDIITICNESNLGFPKACNQGIDIATGDNILLLNNDTIVTENWLSNLLICLHSSDDIGAVGAVTNYCSYYQTIPVSYQSNE